MRLGAALYGRTVGPGLAVSDFGCRAGQTAERRDSPLPRFDRSPVGTDSCIHSRARMELVSVYSGKGVESHSGSCFIRPTNSLAQRNSVYERKIAEEVGHDVTPARRSRPTPGLLRVSGRPAAERPWIPARARRRPPRWSADCPARVCDIAPSPAIRLCVANFPRRSRGEIAGRLSSLERYAH